MREVAVSQTCAHARLGQLLDSVLAPPVRVPAFVPEPQPLVEAQPVQLGLF